MQVERQYTVHIFVLNIVFQFSGQNYPLIQKNHHNALIVVHTQVWPLPPIYLVKFHKEMENFCEFEDYNTKNRHQTHVENGHTEKSPCTSDRATYIIQLLCYF